jgi:hypothetical protein
MINRPEEARREAETVARIRELLDPLTLGPKLDAAFSHLDEPAALQGLSDLCARAGLTRLASLWLTAVGAKVEYSPLSQFHRLCDRQFVDSRDSFSDSLASGCPPPGGRCRLPPSNKGGEKETRESVLCENASPRSARPGIRG